MSTLAETQSTEKTVHENPTDHAADEPRAKRPRCSKLLEWYLYPPSQEFPFIKGDSVLFRSKYKESIRGSVVTILPDERGVEIETDEATESGEPRIVVQEYRRLFPVFHNPAIVVMEETNHFRTMSYQVQATDDVLEIGCSSGETSRLLIPYARSWIGFDTSHEMIEQCRRHIAGEEKKHHIVKIDALIDPKKALENAMTFGTPNVLFVDIGGNRETINVLRMISWVLESFDPRLVVVKSKELARSIQSIPNVDARTGLVPNGDVWFQQHKVSKRAMPKHPLRAPLILSPNDGKTPICRYHNYHKQGCAKQNCPFDHKHCHACLSTGHIARQCPTLL